MAVMSAVLQFNDGASAKHDVMERAGIPSGEFMAEGSLKKDRVCVGKSRNKDKQKKRRMKIRQAKLQQRQEERESGPSYGCGLYNEANPLQRLGDLDSATSDDEPLLTVQNKLRKKGK